MAEYKISKENLNKVEKFFADEAMKSFGNVIEAKITTIAEQSGVAVATCTKAIKELERLGIISRIPTRSRREVNQYKYLGGKQEKTEHELEEKIRVLEDEVKQLKERLAFYESENSLVKKITVDDELEILVKRK